MTEGTLDDRYLEWLYGRIGSVKNRNPHRSFWHLAKQLYRYPFEWFVPNDDNRVADGKDLRLEFLNGETLTADEQRYWMDLDCSMLEMLIALARRVSFESYSTATDWFWCMIQNLELGKYTDDIYEVSIMEEVEEALKNLNARNYGADGRGGLFPLRNPAMDQRRVEIWYQMQAYLLEGEYLQNGPRVA